tara:strand:- start:1087 stop:1242 length:156 start_codon:yes stop_codon:yes gene_type:complete
MCLFPFQFFIKLVFLGISWYFLVFSHLVLLLNMKKQKNRKTEKQKDRKTER